MKHCIGQITYLDLTRLHRALNAGIRAVIANQEYLNKINVFPVPDGDTGTNMALTLSSILNGTYNRQHETINQYLDAVSECALNGARGNSGTVFAQFFLGFSEAASTVKHRFTTKNFVAAISHASNMAHKAISEPKEGTILTVMRDFSDEVTQQVMSNQQHDFSSLLLTGLVKSQASLNNTTQQLVELKKAGLVDAGAQGFVDFLQGIYDFIETGSVKELKETPQTSDHLIHSTINEEFRYCTECIIKGEDMNLNSLRHQIDDQGNCTIVAGSKKLIKLHVHTDSPQTVFEIARSFGEVSREKADDMLNQQHTIMHIDQKVAILTDSCADFPNDEVASLNINVVPLSVTIDGKNYLDKVSLTPKEFFQTLSQIKSIPTTSQPSLGEFKRQYQYLSTHFESIIALHLSAGISNTISASRTAADSINDNIITINSLTTSAAQGMIVSAAARAAAAGWPKARILTLIDEAIKKTNMFVIVGNIDFLAHGGRISKTKHRIIKFLKIIPIIAFNSTGTSKLIGISRAKSNIATQAFKQLRKNIDNNKRYRFQVIHTDMPTKAKELQERIKMEFPEAISVDITAVSTVISTHFGKGSLGVAFQEQLDI